jgi:hypothetical protein
VAPTTTTAVPGRGASNGLTSEGLERLFVTARPFEEVQVGTLVRLPHMLDVQLGPSPVGARNGRR